MNKNHRETSKVGAIAWFFQRISAILLFVLLMFHFVIYHFVSQGEVKYETVIKNIKSPWWNLMQFIFLISALYHGFNGIWMIVEDYIHTKMWRLFLFSIIVIVGLGLLFVGLLTIFKAGSLI